MPDGWLLGDGGYGCYSWLLTPLSVPDSPAEHNYNHAHKSTRDVIERCFGVLKSRFRCLDKSAGLLLYSPLKTAEGNVVLVFEYSPKCVLAAEATQLKYNVGVGLMLVLMQHQDDVSW
ncbi:putative nuclease HARBI1 [Pseudophryne corroboree]|uniref:putative nuclease HARBI1 n=1 Tax=Pseudophryne corroboree TaxID=495146 RepID=UPI0030816ABC